MFLTGQGMPRRRLTKNEGFPATDAGRAAKDRLRAIELEPAVVTSLHALRSLPPAQFSETQWAVLGALMLLLPVAVAQLRQVFQEEGCVDFTEIAIGARTALGSRKLPRQVDTSKGDCSGSVILGRNVRGGTRPRLSCGRSWLYETSQRSVRARTSASDSKRYASSTSVR